MMADQGARNGCSHTGVRRDVEIRGLLQITRLEKQVGLREAVLSDHIRGIRAIAFQGGVTIIILCRAMVDTKSSADDAFPLESIGGPRDAKPRIKVFVVGIFQGIGGRADSIAILEVEDFHPAVGFIYWRVVVPA